MDHAFTVGVEEEFQIVDPDTWELRSHVSELLASGAASLGDQLKREMHQSIVEVGTKICANIDELEAEIYKIRRDLSESAERVGLRIAAAGTHPFSRWMMKRGSVPNSSTNARAFRRRIPTIVSSFFNCSRPTAPHISSGRTL